ncbi:MAG TPA: bacillithiol biosynthesis cysteine-adding enzyme BshC [Anaerolineae bacterium]|nr:bacillithiol biosynthesis cysteine-adding enzyme BshC [Anaerolineae bacterium]
MLKAVNAEHFFTGTRPKGIPPDIDVPDMERLIASTQTLEFPNPYLETLKAILECEHVRLGAGYITIDMIRSIDSTTTFVVGGQQAGLFGGPLYTIYKAMHAVRLASRLSECSARNVVPIFWVASDDHDFDEVKRIGVRSTDGRELSLTYTPRQLRGGEPVGEIIIDDGISVILDSLSELMPSGNNSRNYLEILRTTWQPGIKWSDAFSMQMLRLFAPYGLVMFDPRWKGIKNFFKDIFAAELNEPKASVSLVNEEAEKIELPLKRKKAIRKSERSTNLFLEINGIRSPLFFTGQEFKAGEHTFTKRELLDMVNVMPERFSPAAALRAVCQDAVLPVAAYIAGPGERVYLEQIKPLYAHFGVNGSIIWPRASFTVLDPRTMRTAQKEHIALFRLFDDYDLIRTDFARKTFPEDVNKDFDSLEHFIESGFNSLAASIHSLDSTLINSVKKDKGRMIHIIHKMKERALRAHKASVRVSESRFAAAFYFLRPRRGPQERWFGMDSIIHFLGDKGFEELIMLTSPNEEHHRIIMPE